MTDSADMTVKIAGIDSSTLQQLRERFNDLEELAAVEPNGNSVTEDRELGTVALVITLTAAGINLTTAVLNFLSQRKK